MLSAVYHRREFAFAEADGDSLEKFPPRTNSLSYRGSCLSPSKLLSYHQSPSPGKPVSPQTLGIPRRDEIDYNDNNDNDRKSTSIENSNITDLPPKKETEKEAEETSKKNDEIVKLLVRQIEVGMKKMTKRKEAFDPLTIDASYFLGQSEEIRALFVSIFAKIKQIQAQNLQRERGATEDVCGLAKLFENGEARGKTNERKAHVWKMWRWWFWYFHSCLRIIFFNWRQMERDRKANGAYVMHLIVNDLLATEGISALAVIAALAGKARKI